MAEYECNHCRLMFTNSEPEDSEEQVKCPECGGTQIKKADARSRIRAMFRALLTPS